MPSRLERKLKLDEGLKWCNGHSNFAPIDQFSPRSGRCRICRNGRIKELGQQTSHKKKMESQNKPRNKEQKRMYYIANRHNVRNHQLMRTYGISLEQYNSILISQGGYCALCSATSKSGKNLAVDHDHLTGQIRGLLCSRCNTSLERIERIPNWSETAKHYLAKSNGIK